MIAIVPTACGIETILELLLHKNLHKANCNSTYRLRYWNLMNVALNAILLRELQ